MVPFYAVALQCDIGLSEIWWMVMGWRFEGTKWELGWEDLLGSREFAISRDRYIDS